MKMRLILTLSICFFVGIANGAEPEQEITLDLGGAKLEMVLIPAGSFMMGDARGQRDENPVHKVNITKPFYMAKYEVTQDQWTVVMNGPAPGKFQDPKHPVESVDRNQVAAFMTKLNEKLGGRPFGGNWRDFKATPGTYRLPTEAEWEYACRAGADTRYHFGDDAKELGEYAWYYENSDGNSHPVGQKKPNDWGLYDMHGNVWEMCSDEYFADFYAVSPPNDPPGPRSGSRHVSVVRGGGWNYTAKSCRSGDRGYLTLAHNRQRSDTLGFRVARSVEEK